MAAPEKISIAMTPSPVIVGQPWHVIISGLRPGEDKILLGIGDSNFGNSYLPETYAADDGGKIETDPPILSVTDTAVTFLAFTVARQTGQNDKLLATEYYKIAF